MSANEHTDTVFECIRGGAEDYLLKPVTKKEVQYIWQHVWRRQQQNALRVPNIQEEVRCFCILCLPQCALKPTHAADGQFVSRPCAAAMPSS